MSLELSPCVVSVDLADFKLLGLKPETLGVLGHFWDALVEGAVDAVIKSSEKVLWVELLGDANIPLSGADLSESECTGKRSDESVAG